MGGLLKPDDILKTRPGYFSAGSVEEMMIALQYSFPAWWQHEGALELLHSAKAIAAKDSDVEIDDMMEGSTFKTYPGSDRTRAELLEDVSRNRLWGYMDWATEDSRNLSDEKPSDRHMRRIPEIWEQGESEDDTDMNDTDTE